MKQALEKLQEVNKLLSDNAKEEKELGLLHGKLGLIIYFFQFGRKTNNHLFLEVAEDLVGELFEKLNQAKLSADFENGFAGIAYGISYMVNSDFVEADLDNTLSDIDDRIFKYIEEQNNKLPANLQRGIIGYLLYSLNRLEYSLKSGHKTNILIFQKLSAKLLNQLGQLIEEEKIQDREPQLFNIFWDLPLVLIVLAKAKSLNVNTSKIDRILDYLLPSLLSLLPNLHSNRLYLLLGIELFLKEKNIPELKKHAIFLKESIDLECIFNNECKNLNIKVMDGVSGLKLIGEKLAEITGDNYFIPRYELIFNKINNAVCWDETEFYSPFKKSIGLVSGLSGIGWTLLENKCSNLDRVKVINSDIVKP
ncbi:lanthionine synthetase LanC family protein [Algoriphagus pacificus]|uniref:Lanthionine synthetase C-like protein n=1 Tax=Algoriphagus pacificus TaxID=2811234 RepID=A0ABS3CQU8_9BACT|nr:lanthionine synthetase LanC family protein [Algoriphagus pacificus]MBN7818034.1 hypothetical protein [Algoriphagus pacificus]